MRPLRICQGTDTGLYYTDEVSESILVPYARWHGNALILQDDKSRAHRARDVQNHLQFCRITTLPWPAKSPDLSPTGHVWDIPGRRVRGQPHKPQDVNELADAVRRRPHKPRTSTSSLMQLGDVSGDGPTSHRTPTSSLMQLGDLSGDGLTSHRTPTNSLIHSRRNG